MTEILCLGDSLTFGPGVNKKWTTLAGGVNLGVPGDTTAGMLARLQTLFADKSPVLVMGGTNDIFYTGSDVTARCNLGAIIQQLQARGIPVWVGIPLPICPEDAPKKWAALADFEVSATLLESYCQWLRTFCQAFDVPVVDFRADFQNTDGTPRRELYLDGLHPNAEGHRIMAARLREALA